MKQTGRVILGKGGDQPALLLGGLVAALLASVATGGAAQSEMASGRWAWWIELFEGVGITVLVTIFGFVILAIVGAAVGYVASSFVWRIMVARKRARQLKRMEARLDDRLVVHTTHRAASPVRWVFDQEVRRDGQVLFRAEVTAVCMTLDGRPTRLPRALRGMLP